MIKLLDKFEEEDVKKASAFLMLVKQGKFEIKGDAITTVASLFLWADKLEGKIDGTLKQARLDKKKDGAPKIKKKGE